MTPSATSCSSALRTGITRAPNRAATSQNVNRSPGRSSPRISASRSRSYAARPSGCRVVASLLADMSILSPLPNTETQPETPYRGGPSVASESDPLAGCEYAVAGFITCGPHFRKPFVQLTLVAGTKLPDVAHATMDRIGHQNRFARVAWQPYARW
jgi:hypothetical protein